MLTSKIYKELIKLDSKKQIIKSKNVQKTPIDIFPKKTSKCPEDREKMLNITDYQGNINQNYYEISLHTHQNGYNQQYKRAPEWLSH